MALSSFAKILLCPSLDVQGVFCVRERALNFNSSTFVPHFRDKVPSTCEEKCQTRLKEPRIQTLEESRMGSVVLVKEALPRGLLKGKETQN